jgi:peptidase C13-like protein
MNSLLRFVAAWLCAAGLLLPGTASAAQRAKPAPQWQAVLAAGDNAQPVFDNATDALGHFLGARRVPAADIHRLSASDTGAEPSSAERLLARIASLPARPGERCLVFITSHGREDEGVWLAHDREYLQPAALAQALSGGCARLPTVAIVSACFSGSFAEGAMRAPNRIVLTAARGDRPSFGCQADRTYTFFDECLIGALPGAGTWRAAFAKTVACVGRLEHKLGARPSEPRAFFGSSVRDLPVP